MAVAESAEIFTFLDELLAELADDHVGLWVVVRRVHEFLGVDRSAEVKTFTLGLLGFLLKEGLIVAGFPAPNGKDFDPWKSSPEETIKRVSDEWDKLGRDPKGGEIAWFTAPC
jgi:hypothetical protein